MKTIGLLIRPRHPHAIPTNRDAVGYAESVIVPYLRTNGYDVVVVEGEYATGISGVSSVTESMLGSMNPRMDMLVVLGGDGTLVYAARMVNGKGIPILGLNFGHLGFLSAGTEENGLEILSLALAGSLKVRKHARLHCSLIRSKGDSIGFDIVNEVLVGRPKVGVPTIDVLVRDPIDGEEEDQTTFRADALIVSTQTGSTAYNRSAGGPILAPNLKGIVLTTICPLSPASPVVVPLTSEIEVTLGSHMKSLDICIDGQWDQTLNPGDKIVVRDAKDPIQFFVSPHQTFFKLIKEKVKWNL